MDLDYKKIGFRIGERRRELNIKQVELAEAIGISSKYLSNIEKGVKHASVETLFLLSNALNTTTDYFLLGNIRADSQTLLLLTHIRICCIYPLFYQNAF